MSSFGGQSAELWSVKQVTVFGTPGIGKLEKISCVLKLTGYVCFDLKFENFFEAQRYRNLTDNMKFKVNTSKHLQYWRVSRQ